MQRWANCPVVASEHKLTHCLDRLRRSPATPEKLKVEQTPEWTPSKYAHLSKWQIIISITVRATSRKGCHTHTPTQVWGMSKQILQCHLLVQLFYYQTLISKQFICIFCMYNLQKVKDYLDNVPWTVDIMDIQRYSLDPMFICVKIFTILLTNLEKSIHNLTKIQNIIADSYYSLFKKINNSHWVDFYLRALVSQEVKGGWGWRGCPALHMHIQCSLYCKPNTPLLSRCVSKRLKESGIHEPRSTTTVYPLCSLLIKNTTKSSLKSCICQTKEIFFFALFSNKFE